MLTVRSSTSSIWRPDSGTPGDQATFVDLLAWSGHGDAPGFWDLARVLSELLPEGERERTMYKSLTTSQERLSREAASQANRVFTQGEMFTP